MSDSRTIPALALVGSALLVAALAFLVLDDGSSGGADVDGIDVVDADGRRSDDISTADAPLSSDGGDRTALEFEQAAAEDETVTYVEVDGLVRGRVVLAGGGPIPVGATIEMRLLQPRPLVHDTLSSGIAGSSPFEPPQTPTTSNDIPQDLKDFASSAGLEANADSLMRLDKIIAKRTRTTLDADGHFTLPRVPARGGFVAIEDRFVFADATFLLRPEAAQAAVGPNAVLVEVPAERGAVVRGVVRSTLGDALDDATVELTSRFDPWMIFDGAITMVYVTPGRSDQKGRYEVRQVPSGHALSFVSTRRAHARAGGAVPVLRPGDVHDLDIVMLRGGAIAGRTIDVDDEPVTNAAVFIRPLKVDLMDLSAAEKDSDRTSVDEEGRFEFDELAAGQYELILSAPSMRVTIERVEVALGETTECTLLAVDGLAIDGRVVSSSGEPLAGIAVKGFKPPTMMSMQSQLERKYRVADTTDEEGRFSIGGFDEGAVRVVASSTAYQTATIEVEAGDDDVEITCLRHASLSGIVVSLEDGEPITKFMAGIVPPGGSLSITDMMGGERALAGIRHPRPFESEDGIFHFDDVLPGEYDLHIAADHHAAAFVRVQVPDEAHVRGVVVMMEPGATITGQVVDANTNLPVSGARLSTGSRGIMNVMSEVMLGVGSSTTTAADGRFTLRDLEGGKLQINVSHNDYLTLSVANIDAKKSTTSDLGVLAMSRGAIIEGYVLDASDEPVPNVLVMASDAMGSTMRRENTDADGFFSVSGMPPGTYNVMRLDVAMDVSSDNYADMSKNISWEVVEVVDDGVYHVDLAIADNEGITLEGHIRSRSGAPPAAMVSLIPNRSGMGPFRFGSADAEGFYSVTGLSPGPYTLQVVPMEVFEGGGAGGMPTSSVTAAIELTDEPLQTHDIKLPSGFVRGVVRRKGSLDPVAEARVLLQRTDDERPDSLILAATDHRVGEIYTKEDGSFELRYLPDGVYNVTVGGRNLIERGNPDIAITREDDVVVSERGPSFALTIEVEPAGRVRGIVRDMTGMPAGGVSVWARDPSGRWLSRLSEVMTEPSGAFELVGLGAGTWTLAFAHSTLGFTWQNDVRVDVSGITQVDVTMPPGVQVLVDAGDLELSDIEAEVSGPIGILPTNLTTIGQLTSLTSGTGSSLLVTVPAGEWTVKLEHDGRTLHREVVVLKAGQKTHTIGPFK